MKRLPFVIFLVVCLALVLAGGVQFLYKTAPNHRGNLTHFDCIIVLGSPANPDGSPGPEGRERTLEAVREFRAGVAPHIIMSGGAAHNQYPEGHIMAVLAESVGVPAATIVEENSSQNTIQNAFYSTQLMQAHGWHSAEIVSSASHLPRAGLIFSHFPIEWRTHASPWPRNLPQSLIRKIYFGESLYCSRLRLFGFPHSRFLP